MKNFTKKQVLLLVLSVVAFVLPVQTQAQTDPAVAWAERFGATFYGGGSCATTSDANGNVYMTGQFTGTADFGDITLTSTSGTTPDVFVVKINASGTVLWAEKFGGNLEDFGVSIASDALGNVYTAGVFNDTATFGSFTLTTESGYRNIFVTKQNASGEVLWAEKFTCTWAPNTFLPWGITVDSQGDVYTTGRLSWGNGNEHTATFGNITLTTTAGDGDTFVVKQNPSGEVLWAEIFEGTENTNGGVSGSNITSDVFGNVYIIGVVSGTVELGNTNLTNSSGGAFVMKMDTSGEVLWAKHLGEDSFSSYAFGVATDTAEMYMLQGILEGK